MGFQTILVYWNTTVLDFLIVILFQFYKQQLQTEKKNNRKNDKSVASPSKKISLIQEKTPPAMIRKLTSLSWFWLYFQILYVIAFFFNVEIMHHMQT